MNKTRKKSKWNLLWVWESNRKRNKHENIIENMLKVGITYGITNILVPMRCLLFWSCWTCSACSTYNECNWLMATKREDVLHTTHYEIKMIPSRLYLACCCRNAFFHVHTQYFILLDWTLKSIVNNNSSQHHSFFISCIPYSNC